MSVATLIVTSLILVEAFFFLRLDEQARAALRTARDAAGVLADRHISDDEKESCARKASRLVFKLTAVLTLKLIILAVVLYAIFLGVAWIHPPSAASLLAALTSPLVLASVTLIALVYVRMRNAIL